MDKLIIKNEQVDILTISEDNEKETAVLCVENWASSTYIMLNAEQIQKIHEWTGGWLKSKKLQIQSKEELLEELNKIASLLGSRTTDGEERKKLEENYHRVKKLWENS